MAASGHVIGRPDLAHAGADRLERHSLRLARRTASTNGLTRERRGSSLEVDGFEDDSVHARAALSHVRNRSRRPGGILGLAGPGLDARFHPCRAVFAQRRCCCWRWHSSPPSRSTKDIWRWASALCRGWISAGWIGLENWLSPLIVRITLFDDSRMVLVYPGDLDSCNSLLRHLRRLSRDALIDGVPYRQFWGEVLAPGGDRRQIPPPRYRMLLPEDEAEVERLYQRLKTVGHLDQKNSADEK